MELKSELRIGTVRGGVWCESYFTQYKGGRKELLSFKSHTSLAAI